MAGSPAWTSVISSVTRSRPSGTLPADPMTPIAPLTPDGARGFRKAARGLRRVVPKVDGVLSSPYVLAWETAKVLAAEAGWSAPIRCYAVAGE
jgi:broad specificity phosphatase PhoE